jgi:hypothetical protein
MLPSGQRVIGLRQADGTPHNPVSIRSYGPRPSRWDRSKTYLFDRPRAPRVPVLRVMRGQQRSLQSPIVEYPQVQLPQLRIMIAARSSKLAMPVRSRSPAPHLVPAQTTTPPDPGKGRRRRPCHQRAIKPPAPSPLPLRRRRPRRPGPHRRRCSPWPLSGRTRPARSSRLRCCGLGHWWRAGRSTPHASNRDPSGASAPA